MNKRTRVKAARVLLEMINTGRYQSTRDSGHTDASVFMCNSILFACTKRVISQSRHKAAQKAINILLDAMVPNPSKSDSRLTLETSISRVTREPNSIEFRLGVYLKYAELLLDHNQPLTDETILGRVL